MAGDALLALAVLKRLARQPRPMKLGELETELDVSRSSLYRITRDLAQAGWLRSEGSPARFSLTWSAIQLGLSALAHHPAREVTIPHAIEFARVSGRGCAISFYDRGEVIWTDRIRVIGSRVSINLSIRSAPAPSVASGKILLAYQPKEEIERVAALGLPKYARNTRTTRDEILADLAETRARGYGLSRSERTEEGSGFSFPIFDARGNAVAAMGVSPNTGETLEQLMQDTLEIARRMTEIASAELGYRTQYGDDLT